VSGTHRAPEETQPVRTVGGLFLVAGQYVVECLPSGDGAIDLDKVVVERHKQERNRFRIYWEVVFNQGGPGERREYRAGDVRVVDMTDRYDPSA
jgi:hypothetical protein